MGWFIGKLKGGIKCLKDNGLKYTMRLSWQKVKTKAASGAKKLEDTVNMRFSRFGKRLELGLVTVIRVKTFVKDDRYGKVLFVFLFGKQIYPREKTYRPCDWADPNQPVIYFKINRMSDYAKPCVQHWVNIAHQMRADYYFICDNTQLQYHLLRTVNFPGAEIKFIPSIRRPLKRVCSNLCTGHWINATYAHLTPFYDAKKRGLKNFWAIDADDTMICLNHRRVTQALKSVQRLAESEDISVISLDMWRSRTLGRHWSWGIAFVNDNTDYCSLFEKTESKDWIEAYKELDANFNLDWYFTYLKDTKQLNIKTFYIERSYLIHWGSFLREPTIGTVSFWDSGKVYFPILKYVFCTDHLGVVDIADCRRISINATKEEGIEFFTRGKPANKRRRKRVFVPRGSLTQMDASGNKKSS